MPRTIIRAINEPFEEYIGGQIIVAGTLFCISFTLIGISLISNYPLWIKLPLYVAGAGTTLLFLFCLLDILFIAPYNFY